MRIISKKISYNNLVSRIPGVIPSLKDTWTVPSIYACGTDTYGVYYSYPSAVEKASEYHINTSQLKYNAEFVEFDNVSLKDLSVGNYGLIPSDIIIPNSIAVTITDYTDIYVNIPNGEGGFYDLSYPKKSEDPHYEGRKIISGETEIKILTYNTLNKWYTFFKKYYGLINSSDDKRIFNSALECYNATYDGKNDEARKEYENMDATFLSRGGEAMYNWICDNCIIQFKIPSKFVNKWKTNSIYYPDAVKWYWWFKERAEKYENVNYESDCTQTTNCCDCKEYLELGGHEFYEELSNWLESLNGRNCDFATKSASITIPILITNSINDLGEMSIMSEDWDDVRDYHNTLDNSPGTVVHQPYLTNEDNGEKTLLNYTYIISGSTQKGYEYNEYFEDIFKEDDWGNYTDYCINGEYHNFFNSDKLNNDGEYEAITSYTFSPINGKVIYNPTEVTANTAINNEKVTLINGSIYNVIDGKYVYLCNQSNSIANIRFKKNSKLPVFKDGNLEYVLFNGKKKYVELCSDGKERVFFFKDIKCKDKGCEVYNGEYVIYENVIYMVDNNKISIDDDFSKKEYDCFDGYFYVDNVLFFIKNNKVVVPDEKYNIDDGINYYTYREPTKEEYAYIGVEKIEVDGDNAKIYYLFDKIDSTKITGYTESKLTLLRRKEISTDDLGNDLPGYFRSIVNIDGGESQSNYNNAYTNCTLDILYKVGEVAELEQNELLEDRYNGNIITSIVFYFLDDDGSRIHQTSAMNDNALSVISEMTTFGENSTEYFDRTLYCDITYHIGAVIKRNEDKYELDENFHSGVKYTDTVLVSKNVGKYYVDAYNTFPFIYYLLTPNSQTSYISDFNTISTEPTTKFEMTLWLYHYNNGRMEVIGDNNMWSGWSKHNNTMVAPMFRQEFEINSSSSKNVDADIYIDRGIASAFERHLKLQEFRTMEALADYGINFFKINNQ